MQRTSRISCYLAPFFIALILVSSGKAQPFAKGTGQSGSSARAPSLTLPADNEIDRHIAEFEKRIKDFSRADSLAITDAVAPGTRTGELKEYQRLNKELGNIMENHAHCLRELKEIRQMNKGYTAEQQASANLPDNDHDMLSLRENLYNSISSEQVQLKMLEWRKAVTMRQLTSYMDRLKRTGSALRLNAEKTEGMSDDKTRERWLDGLAAKRNQISEAGVLFSETQRLVLQEATSGKQAYVRFLESRLERIENKGVVSKSDLERRLVELSEKRDSLAEEKENALRLNSEAEDYLRQARMEIDSARLLSARKETLQRLQAVLQVCETNAETAAMRIQLIQGMIELVELRRSVWEGRAMLLTASNHREIRSSLQKAQQDIEYLTVTRSFVDSEFPTILDLINAQQQKVSSSQGNETDSSRQLLDAYKAREGLFLRLARDLIETESQVRRWEHELSRRSNRTPLLEKIRLVASSLWDRSRNIWNVEVYIADQTVVADGKKVAKPTSVTIGKIIEAFAILALGTWIARRSARIVKGIAERLFRQKEHTAFMISRALFLIIFAIVLVFAVVFVNIPLAVFAFFGGALAIGLGFGAQHLINNFLSGLILMFGQSVRVGDVVEIDGEHGRVIEIGMRSSVIQRFDGVELLVPNSHFVQQKVTNCTLTDNVVRYAVSVSVPHGAPAQQVSGLLLRAADEHQLVLDAPPASAILKEFAGASMLFTVYFWLRWNPTVDPPVICSEIRHRMSELLEQYGIPTTSPGTEGVTA